MRNRQQPHPANINDSKNKNHSQPTTTKQQPPARPQLQPTMTTTSNKDTNHHSSL